MSTAAERRAVRPRSTGLLPHRREGAGKKPLSTTASSPADVDAELERVRRPRHRRACRS